MSSIDQARIFERDDLHFSVLTSEARPKSDRSRVICVYAYASRVPCRRIVSVSVWVSGCAPMRETTPRPPRRKKSITDHSTGDGTQRRARRRRRPARSDATPHSTRGRARRAELRETRLEVRSAAGVAPAPARIRVFLSLWHSSYILFLSLRCAEDSAHAHTRRPGTPCPRSAPATSDSVLAVRRAQRPLVTLLRCVPA
jgi:hypothetical protein